jgi:hypothetical protein
MGNELKLHPFFNAHQGAVSGQFRVLVALLTTKDYPTAPFE